MNVRRFIAASMQEALKRVREEMGPDAVILSSRKTDGGVEIVASVQYDEEAARQGLQSTREEPKAVREDRKPNAEAKPVFSEPKSAVKEPTPGEIARYHAQRHVMLQEEMARSREKIAKVRETRQGRESAPATAITSAPATQRAASDEKEMAEMRAQLNRMQELLDQQMRQAAAGSKELSLVQQGIQEQLLQMGIERDLVQPLLARTNDSDAMPEGWRKVLTHLSRAVSTESADIIRQGGVIALIGPTGSGKTTTIGKMAARYVLENGPEEIALVTTDRYRIAAHEQLMVFGRILNVPVRVVDEANSLDAVLASLSDKKLVLIDTAGLNHLDPHWSEQLQELRRSRFSVKNYLVISAINQPQIMKSTYHNYKMAGLAGCVVTKTDEAVTLGEVISFLIRSRLRMAYLTDGQKIPDDIHPADAPMLIKRADELLQTQAVIESDFGVLHRTAV
ncbi:MAG: flagellar biosynthesis protein FlhF [Hahellaceae bacterium]|nr:flagellar biosynthesis protein FlhF [Hahellaceae bacterium]